MAVIDAQDGLEVGQQIRLRQELAHHLANDRRASESPSGQNLEAELAAAGTLQPHANVMHLDRGAIAGTGRDRDLELTRQIAEFRMQRGPLTDEFAVGPRVGQLIGGDACQMIRGDVADAVAAGLDCMHLHLSQLRQDVRHLLELRPVELDVLPGGEMPVAAIVGTCDLGQRAQLAAREQAVRHGDAQHWCKALDVEAIAQAQRPKFILAERPRKEPLGLVAELRHPFVDQGLVDLIVSIHRRVRISGSLRKCARDDR